MKFEGGTIRPRQATSETICLSFHPYLLLSELTTTVAVVVVVVVVVPDKRHPKRSVYLSTRTSFRLN